MSGSRKLFEGFGNNISELYELALRKELYSEYTEKELIEVLSHVIGELHEVEEEILADEIELVKEEISDSIFIFMMLLVKMTNSGILDSDYFETFGRNIKNKIIKRAPHIKKHKRISQEEEDKIRYLTKKL